MRVKATCRKIKAIPEIISKVVSKVPDKQVMSDLDATVAWAKAHRQRRRGQARHHRLLLGRPDRLALLGAQSQGEGRRRLVRPAWCRRATELQPKHPIDVVAAINAPILGLYGEADQGIPVASVEKMRAALKEAGKTAEIILYPDTPHAFFADYRPSYRKEQAEDGWKRMLEWFKKNGVA